MKIKIPIGIGGNINGEAVFFDAISSSDTSHITSKLKGKILICSGHVSEEFLQKAAFLGVAGLVVASLHYKDFLKLSQNEGMTVLVMKRFGLIELTVDEEESLRKIDSKSIKITRDEGHAYVMEITS